MKKIALGILLFCCPFVSQAERVEAYLAQCAIESWLSQNTIALLTLEGAVVESLEPYGNLWVAKLDPCGYVVVSGSDILQPILAFSQNEFTDPDPASPFYTLLTGSSEAVDTAEAKGGVRHADWVRLVGGRDGLRVAKARAAVRVDSSAVMIDPFLTTKWNQWQPYNDFAPIWDSQLTSTSSGYEVYRGRTPSGCVATALAQILYYWQWPNCMEGPASYAHSFTPDNTTQDFAIRFDGHNPFDWQAMTDSYPYYNSSTCKYDMRGNVKESVRFPVARLLLFADHLAQMAFAPGGSSAYNSYAAGNLTPWYELENPQFDFVQYDFSARKYVSIEGAIEKGASLVKADLVAKRPVLVGIPGHAVVAHGWAEDSSNRYYLYLNYGYGGTNDGWYVLSEEDSVSRIENVCLGLYPRKMVQMEPLPKQVGQEVTLKWAFPPCYESDIAGFKVTTLVRLSPPLAPITWFDDCSALDGRVNDASTLSIKDITPPGIPSYKCFSFQTHAANSYTYPSFMDVTATTTLSVTCRSYYALGAELDVQVRPLGGEWATVARPTLAETGSTDWETTTVSLSDYQGETIQLRLLLKCVGNSYYPSGYIDIDRIQLSDIYDYSYVDVSGEENSQTVPATARSCPIKGLTLGAKYAWEVTPLFKDGSGVAVDRVVAESVTDAELVEAPAIRSVRSSEGITAVQEGFYRENALGKNILWVQGSPSVTSLEAYPSHLSLINDNQVTVHAVGGGLYAVEIDATNIPNRSRLILTLAAKNANGAVVYKDLSLRFSLEMSSEPYEDPLADGACVTMTNQSIAEGSQNNVKVPVAWFVEKGLVEATATVDICAEIATADTDGDGVCNWVEYVLGTDPMQEDEKLTISITMTDGVPVVDYSPKYLYFNNYRTVLKGTDDLASPHWEVKKATHKFFKVVIEEVK